MSLSRYSWNRLHASPKTHLGWKLSRTQTREREQVLSWYDLCMCLFVKPPTTTGVKQGGLLVVCEWVIGQGKPPMVMVRVQKCRWMDASSVSPLSSSKKHDKSIYAPEFPVYISIFSHLREAILRDQDASMPSNLRCLRDVQECICQHLAFTRCARKTRENMFNFPWTSTRQVSTWWRMVYSMKYAWSTGVSKFDLFSISTHSTENEHQSLTRQATPRDWERCKVYACRIRCFGVQDGTKSTKWKAQHKQIRRSR